MEDDDFGPEDEGFAAFVEAYHSCSGSDVSDDDTADEYKNKLDIVISSSFVFHRLTSFFIQYIYPVHLHYFINPVHLHHDLAI